MKKMERGRDGGMGNEEERVAEGRYFSIRDEAKSDDSLINRKGRLIWSSSNNPYNVETVQIVFSQSKL